MKQFILCCFIFLLYTSVSNSQESAGNKEKAVKALSDYFLLERENIYLHFDKDVFFTNEEVAFKGYVFHRKKNIPFFSTINIYAALLDDEGKILEKQLLYGNIGSFSGTFKLNNSYKTGKYYIQTYTNWMNNFLEDESSVYEIDIINKDSKTYPVNNKPNYSNININFNPEGGTLLADSPNSVGISISACNGVPLPVSVVDIVDDKGKVLKKVQINKLGYGKFDITPLPSKQYKASFTANNVVYEQILPNAQTRGINLEVNNYSIADKTIIKIRTNHSSLSSFTEKPLLLVIHQDEKATIFDLKFDSKNLEQTLVFSNDNLFEGLNTLRVIDADMKQVAQRMIYKYPAENLKMELKKISENTFEYGMTGKINYPNMNISVSVLPINTISYKDQTDLYGAFWIAPYIKNKNVAGKYYLNSLSKGKHYELDLFLLNQQTKYEWRNITNTPPSGNFVFDMGLTLKGNIGQIKTDKSASKVRLYSLSSSIDEVTEIDAKNEFYYHNLIIPDSSYVNFTVVQRNQQPKELKIAPQTVNGNREFYKMFIPSSTCKSEETALLEDTDFEMPNFYNETVILEEIKVESKRLKYENSFGNANLTGHRVTESDHNIHRNVLQFIKYRGGFDIIENGIDVEIYSRGRNSINAAQSSPIIYIDNMQLFDYTQLTNIFMTEVEEIYINAHAIVPSVRNFNGIIKIYLNKGVKSTKNKSTTPDIIVKNGFKRIIPFENIEYNSTADKGFQNFGLIDWHPIVMTDEKGEFKFKIPKTSQKTLQFIIEGFSADGKLFSEIRTLNLR